MTLLSAFQEGKRRLQAAGCDEERFKAACLLEKQFHKTQTDLMLRGDETVEQSDFDEYLHLIDRCASGEPLQYILGEWEFMGLPFFVGQGVLIPRQDTEALVEYACEKLKYYSAPVVLDLCSGSGCIGISIAKLCPNAKVYMVELSEQAGEYLKRNLAFHGLENAFFVQGDLFDSALREKLPKKFDAVLSNPPYIPTGELADLQKEVHREPVTALDGGNDGLDFYREIVSGWFPLLSENGFAAVECGYNQAHEIKKLFSVPDMQVKIIKDYCGIERVVVTQPFSG